MKSVLAYLLAATMIALVKAAEEEEVDEASVFRGKTPLKSWEYQSPNNNPWTDTTVAGALIGFIVFGLSYIYVVVMIFYDINKSKNMYIELVEEDKQIIDDLKVSPGMRADWEQELQNRLTGKSGDSKLDD